MWNSYRIKELFMGKLPHGGDLLAELEKICSDKNIKTGILTAIGAVKNATVGFL